MSGLDASERRVLNPRPFRVFRKTYSTAEVKAGGAVIFAIGLLAAWVAWKGAHPDPALFADPATAPAAAKKLSGRGPLPAGLASGDWSEGTPSSFDARNLYVKINGRADFFLSRGFRSLTFVTLSGPGGTAVDIEWYDLGSAENALGAFSAEKPPAENSRTEDGTSWYISRNALFVARGTAYIRAIGSDESGPVKKQLQHLRVAVSSAVATGEKPWTVTLFGDSLGIPGGRLNHAAENAFSFGFARNVTWGTLEDGETELFVMPAPDEATAADFAAKFEEGFLNYGEKVTANGAVWVKDRYLSTFARALPAGLMAVGVRGAKDPAQAAVPLEKLRAAAAALPPDVVKKAAKGPAETRKEGGAYE
ncbi:MAG: hypothetical protein L6R30_23860 [Thermoanaerobaculia bacterium]|nr:hypothetical protein [Thermoanaerobaculia bacterium]